MGKTFLRTEPGERIGQPDFQHAAEVSQRDSVAGDVDTLLVGRDIPTSSYSGDQPKAWIVKGFTASNPSGKVVRISKDDSVGPGAAILSARERGKDVPGLILAEGESSKDIDITNLPAGTYGVFIRFEFRDSQFQNRSFWNSIAATPVEFPRVIPTRRAEDWGVSISLQSPGPGWLKIHEVDQATMAFTDFRNFFFEGRSSNSWILEDSDWGGGTDRLPTRPGTGVFGFARWVKAVARQIQDIVGNSGWWSDPQGGTQIGGAGPRSLTQLNDEKFDRKGSQFMEGDVVPNDNSHSLGDPGTTRRWNNVYAKTVEADTIVRPKDDVTQNLGNATPNRWLNVFAKIFNGNNVVLSLLGEASTFIKLNDDAAAADKADITKATGGAPLIVRSGDAGQSAMELRGTDVKLAVNCNGQNGLYYESALSVEVPQNDVSQTSDDYSIAVPITGASPDIVIGDTVIALHDTTITGARLMVEDLVIVDYFVSGTNIVTVRVFNRHPSANRPTASRFFKFDIVILRR